MIVIFPIFFVFALIDTACEKVANFIDLPVKDFVSEWWDVMRGLLKAFKNGHELY